MEKEKAQEIVDNNLAEYKGQIRRDISNGTEFTIYDLFVYRLDEDDFTVLCDLDGKRIEWCFFNDIERASVFVRRQL